MEESEYDIAQICLSGHVINSTVKRSPEYSRNFCDRCGAPTITSCQECNAPIQGQSGFAIISMAPFIAAAHCPNCGAPYPWTESQPEAARELASEVDIAEDRVLLKLARDLAQAAETAAAEAKSQGATAMDRSYEHNIEQYNLVVAKARQKYPKSDSLRAVPPSIERVQDLDKGIADYLSPTEHNKVTEVTDKSRRLRIALEEIVGRYPEVTEMLQALSFDFIAMKDLRQIAQRDKIELVSAYENDLWKCVVLLCGGLAESMLCDTLSQREQEAKAKYQEGWPSKKQRDLFEWNLYELTTVARDLGEVSTDVADLAHKLRDWRNLIHPGKEARGIIKPEREEADLAVRMIGLLARDLRRKEPTSNE